ncbi:ABC transporter permease [Georgenia sp. H159]|uniref:ABC transporter permease n=1 Tax=Georgenia sp. H159 TaxID=3076115 RepID=UPI002D786877|nr:ABC transporter permease [Georgenia sp. H159]
MTTTTTHPAAASPAAGTSPGRAEISDLSFGGVLRGEWIKLLSLRSTWWTLAMTVAVTGLISLAVAVTADDVVEQAAAAGLEPHGAELVISGFQFGMVTIAVLGALLMTGEFGTGMVRSTFAAVPSRLPVLWAKALALTVVTVAASALSVLVGTAAAAPWLTDHGLVPALDQSHTWQAFGGMTYFYVAVALVALGLGAVLRHTAGTITTVLGLLLLLPGILQFITVDWVQDLVSLMPLPAAIAFVGTSGLQGTNEVLTAWQGVAVVGAYAVAALVAGAVCLRRRDA